MLQVQQPEFGRRKCHGIGRKHMAGWDFREQEQPVDAEFVVRGGIYAARRLREHSRYISAAWVKSDIVNE